MAGLRCLGSYDHLEKVLERQKPDEVISAIGVEDYHRMPQIISACEKTGSKLSIIPFYADYMPSNPQFDSLNGIP
ncbi:MAG: nucleoside-diphosphate sugar epimerase/dehydratase [Hydrogeniiclostridium mannosilyticum]